MNVPYILQAHYDNLEKKFHALLIAFQIEPAGKTVHQLRVNIKKQMAFFQMLRTLEPHLPLEEIQAPFSAFFKSIGKIRNLEVRQAIVAQEETNHSITEGFATNLATNIKEEKDWWTTEDNSISLVPFRQASDKIRMSINRIPLHNVRENLGEYFYFLNEEIRQTIHQEKPSAEQLHDLRKFLKVLLFNLKLTDRLIPQSTLSDNLYKNLKALSELLGVWHDQFIAIYKISAKKDKMDKDILNLLRKKERVIRKRILKKFPEIYDLTHDLKQQLFQLFAQGKPMEIPSRKFQEGKYQIIRNSFSQINTLELNK